MVLIRRGALAADVLSDSMGDWRQFALFCLVGAAAAAAHYGVLIGLVEGAGAGPVPATLAGYVVGGAISYGLSRRHVFASARAHRDALWRFAVVAGVGFALTWLIMAGLTGRAGLPYLLAQVLTTGVVLVWSFLAHRFWTFGEPTVIP